MSIHNSDIAGVFNQTADLLELKGGNPFRVRAYRNAARTIQSLSKCVDELISKNKDLSQYPGIGKDLAGKIKQIVKTGKFDLLEELEQQVPEELSKLMNVSGLGSKRVTKLYKELNISDLNELKDAVDSVKRNSKDGKDVRPGNLHDAIQSTKTTRLDKFLYALGIRHVGRHIAQVLARHFESIKSIENADTNNLQEIPEVGLEIAESIAHFFEQKENRKTLQHLVDVGVNIDKMPHNDKEKLPLEGNTFVFTGDMDNYNRNEAKEAVEKMGARVTSGVSGNTDYIVAGDNPGSKLKHGKKHDVKIINKIEFGKLLQHKQ